MHLSLNCATNALAGLVRRLRAALPRALPLPLSPATRLRCRSSPPAGLSAKSPEGQGKVAGIEGLAGVTLKEAAVRRAFGEELYDR